MLLKSMKLTNFRQYIDEEIIFSVDPIKNVTVVVGETGAGKTTLEQAFRYVLYGAHEFLKDELINNKVKAEAEPQQRIEASVSLNFSHKSKEYEITRTQPYVKLESGSLLDATPKLLLVEIRNGNFIPLSDEVSLRFAASIIPKQLSNYFFIDGEKIEKMSKNISENSKQEDFSRVVKAVLGLNTIYNSIKHVGLLKKIYNKEISKLGGESVFKLHQQIESLEDEINLKQNRIDAFEYERTKYTEELNKLDADIRSIPNAEKLQNDFNKRKQEIIKKQNDISKSKNDTLDLVNMNFIYFIGSPLIQNGMDIVRGRGDLDFGIPELHAKTIEHLIINGKCICGKNLNEDTEAKERLIYLKSTVPPYSVGMVINDYIKRAKIVNEAQVGVHNSFAQAYKETRRLTKELDQLSSEQSILSDQIGRINDVVEQKKRYDEVAKHIENLERSKIALVKEIAIAESDIKRLQGQLDEYSLKIEANNRLTIYKNYAEVIEENLKAYLEGKEKDVRKNLESNINDFLTKIYKKGITVSISEKYKLGIHVDEAIKGDDLEQSVGQGYSIIFAFIASVVKMAREKDIDPEIDAITDEQYPLVMDAPISTLDEMYIKNLCEVLPEVSEQIIVFLNNKDAKLFKEYSQIRIGKQYSLDVSGLIETTIREVTHV